jgi:hypothetical protein
MKIISEIDIEFSSRVDPEYEFFEVLSGKYFRDKVKQPEVLIYQSYLVVGYNPGLDNRVKAFMHDNKLTLCETFFPNDHSGFTYIINYSLDNYKTFGLISINSFSKIFQFLGK